MNTVTWILLIVIIVMLLIISMMADWLQSAKQNHRARERTLQIRLGEAETAISNKVHLLNNFKDQIYRASLVSVTKKYVKIGIRLFGTDSVLWWNRQFANDVQNHNDRIPESELKTELKRVKEMFKGDKVSIIVHRYEVTEKVDPNGCTPTSIAYIDVEKKVAYGGMVGGMVGACEGTPINRAAFEPAKLCAKFHG